MFLRYQRTAWLLVLIGFTLGCRLSAGRPEEWGDLFAASLSKYENLPTRERYRKACVEVLLSSTDRVSASTARRLLLGSELEDAVGDEAALVLRNMLLVKLAGDNRKEMRDLLVKFYWGSRAKMEAMSMNGRIRAAVVRSLPLPADDQITWHNIVSSNQTEMVVQCGISQKPREGPGWRSVSMKGYGVSVVFKKIAGVEYPLWLPCEHRNSGVN